MPKQPKPRVHKKRKGERFTKCGRTLDGYCSLLFTEVWKEVTCTQCYKRRWEGKDIWNQENKPHIKHKRGEGGTECGLPDWAGYDIVIYERWLGVNCKKCLRNLPGGGKIKDAAFGEAAP